MIFRNAIKFLVFISLICLTACGGGGDGGGLGTEGTGFRVLIKGRVVDENQVAVQNADLTTDDAAATTGVDGTFSFETNLAPGESLEIAVAAGTTSGTVALNPVTPTGDEQIEVTIRADNNTGTVTLQSQELVRPALEAEEIDQKADSTIAQVENTIDSIADNSDFSSVGEESRFDPDLVDFY